MPVKFRTVAYASPVIRQIKGERALVEPLLAAFRRLERVSGLRGRNIDVAYSTLPRAGDGVGVLVEWSRT